MKGRELPDARKIVSIDVEGDVQAKQIKQWVQKVLNEYIKLNGTFKVDENSNLKEEDFMKIYNLIESMCRYHLMKLRSKNE